MSMTASAVSWNCQKKSWTVPQCGHVTELCTNGVEATKCWVFVAHFSINSTSRCCCHTGTDIPRLHGHTLQINQVVRTVRHRISCCAPTIHWKYDAQIQNRQIKSPPALWKHLSFQCLGVIVTLNGKSASMLLEPTKNKLKQWRVIEKSVNKCNFFSQMFWIITKWMKITEKQICEDQIVTSKQSHILLYQGLLFLTRSTCVIVDARSHTCKSHDFIPRYDIMVPNAWCFSAFTSIGPSIHLPWRFPGIILGMHGRNDLKFGMLKYSDCLQNWLGLVTVCWFS